MDYSGLDASSLANSVDAMTSLYGQEWWRLKLGIDSMLWRGAATEREWWELWPSMQQAAKCAASVRDMLSEINGRLAKKISWREERALRIARIDLERLLREVYFPQCEEACLKIGPQGQEECL